MAIQMEYSNLTQKELDGLLISIIDLYRLYNPSAIPTDELLEKQKDSRLQPDIA